MIEEKVKFSELCNFTPKQLLATKQADLFVYSLFGGAAGPGKSYWLRWYCIRTLIKWGKDYGINGIHGALFCEDYITLKDRQSSKMEIEFPKWLGEIKDNKINGLGFHINPEYGGHVLLLRNLDDPSKYLSSEFAIIAIDELTMNPEEKFHQLRSRLRWTGVPDPKFVAATNPGNIGHSWVKKRWIDKDFPKEELNISDKFVYIPALPTDNPYLAQSYLETLASLPEKKRKAYLEGNWDVFEGQFFTEFDREKHVVEPFTIPQSWIRVRSIDPSGRDGITSCHWYAIDWNGRVFCYREHYGTGLDSDQHAREITRLSQGEEYRYTVIDTAAFDKLGLPETTAEVYMRNGVTGLVPASKKRVMGWDLMHQYLRWDNNTDPKLKIFSTCPNIIRTIPLAIHDELHPEDLDTRGEDHALDDARYVLQTLRDNNTQKPMTPLEKRLKEIRDGESELSFNYRKY
jgi:hypothetical protein